MGYTPTKYENMKKEQIFENLKNRLSQEEDIIFAYLFGSYAKGRPHKNSDIDVAVYLKEPVNIFNRKIELIDLISEITKKNDVDLVILNQAKPFVVYSILKTGKLLFSKDEELRINFEGKNIKEYLDLTYYLNKYWEAMKKRVEENRFGI